MASTATKAALPAETMASAPVFSYAQAARGQAAPSATSQLEISAPPSHSSLGKDDNASTTNTIATSATSSNASDIQDLPKALQESTDLSNLKNCDSEISSVVGSVGQNSHDDAASATGSQSQEPSKGTGSSTVTSQAGDSSSDSRKPRKSKKGKNHEKDVEQEKNKENVKAPEPVKVELSEAPIPSVNIWQQRKEERAAAVAKQTVPAPTKPAAGNADVTADTGKVSDIRKQGSSTDEVPESGNKAGSGSTASGARGPRKPADFSRATGANENFARRNAPRGSRLPGKDERIASDNNPPSVQDAALWPSIELAAADEPKKKATLEKADQLEREKQDESAAKPRPKKEWVAVPITPTFTYETQFTHPKQPRTRGGGRGGRDVGTGRGGHAPATGSPVEKDPATPAGLPPKPASESRERPKDPAGFHPRQSSQAPGAGVPKRGGAESSAREPRKASGAAAADKAKGEHGTGTYPNRGEAPTRGARPDFTSGDQPNVDRRRQSGDRRETRAHDHAVDSNNHPHRGEGRSERGRGGYRGRGGGAGHSAAGHHQQSGYGPNGQRYMGGANGMNSQSFSPTANQYQFSGHGNGRRVPPRAQTGPSHNGQRPQNGAAVPSRMPSMPVPSVSQEYPVQGYPPAYPAAPYGGGEEYILQGLRSQIEYYFSPDNMLRDIYLRTRMDSQGFVLLKTVASFKRVTQMAPRFEFIQAACAQSQEIDYVVGDDGLERLRSRRDMSAFIIEMQNRVEEGRTNGPANFVYHNLDRQAPYNNGFGHHMYTASPTNFHPDFHQNGVEHGYPMYPVNGGHFPHGATMNGDYVNGHRYNGDSQLSASVPDFSPVSHQRPSLEEFQQFQDADVPKLKVIVDGSKPGAAPTNGVTASSAPEEGSTTEKLTNGVSGHPTTASESLEADSRSKEAGAESSSYPEFRSKALGQRKDAAPGQIPQDMHNLYKFWVDLLSTTFNVQLYQEFRQLALEDAAQQPPSPVGVRHLLGFYEAILNSRRPYPEDFDAHYQEAKSITDSLAQMSNGETHA